MPIGRYLFQYELIIGRHASMIGFSVPQVCTVANEFDGTVRMLF